MNDLRDLGQGSKMRAASPILVVAEPDKSSGDSWRRFLAILCFMEFYTGFVRSGTILWESCSGDTSHLSVNTTSWVNALLVLRAFCLYICGRALWFKSKHTRRWIVLAIALTLLSVACTTWAAHRALTELAISNSIPIVWSWDLVKGFILSDSAGMLPILACLISVLILPGRHRTNRSFSMAGWAFVAATWCFAAAIAEQLHDGAASALAYYANSIGMQAPAPFVYSAFVALTGVLLIRRSFLARSTAVVLAAIGVVVAAERAYVLPWLVNMAIKALYASIPANLSDLPYRWVHTRHEFLGVFVDSVTLIGPWLLIALYARFVPMRIPPDDGSPYPRHYCRKCLYNLHGLESDRCPECGAELASGSATT